MARNKVALINQPLESYDHVHPRDREPVKALDDLHRAAMAFYDKGFPFIIGTELFHIVVAVQQGRRDIMALPYYRKGKKQRHVLEA